MWPLSHPGMFNRRPKFSGGDFEVTLYREVGDDDIEITVTGTYDAGTPDKLTGHPDNWHPGDPPEFAIISVMDETGNSLELTESEMTEVEEKATEDCQERYEQVLEDEAVARYEAQNDESFRY